MSPNDKERVLIRQCVENLQDELLKFMSMKVEVISVSSEESFIKELKMSPSTGYKKSSVKNSDWSTDEDIEGYETETNYSQMDVFSETDSPKGKIRKLSGSDESFKILKEGTRKIMSKVKKLDDH